MIVGASGTIGTSIANALKGYDLIKAGFSSGDVRVNLQDPGSIKSMYSELDSLDGVICASGKAEFGRIGAITDDGLDMSLESKLKGQINLVRYGLSSMNKGGFFTLTSGDLSIKPDTESSIVTTVGIALEGFARASSLSMPNDLRINVVSPSLIRESAIKFNLPLEGSVPVNEVAQWYKESAEGDKNGKVRWIEGWY